MRVLLAAGIAAILALTSASSFRCSIFYLRDLLLVVHLPLLRVHEPFAVSARSTCVVVNRDCVLVRRGCACVRHISDLFASRSSSLMLIQNFSARAPAS